jgi:DNA polymerase III subunit epsilon
LSVPPRRSWRAARFIVIDVETTGLDPRTDEVLSFAAVPVDRGRIVARDAVHGLVRPASPPPARSIEIHGLRPDDLAAAPPAATALAPLAAAVSGRVPVAHIAWIERMFLRRHLRALGQRLPRRMVDTALLWRLLCVERGGGDPGACELSTPRAKESSP